jgi:hypothetical protein
MYPEHPVLVCKPLEWMKAHGMVLAHPFPLKSEVLCDLHSWFGSSALYGADFIFIFF